MGFENLRPGRTWGFYGCYNRETASGVQATAVSLLNFKSCGNPIIQQAPLFSTPLSMSQVRRCSSWDIGGTPQSAFGAYRKFNLYHHVSVLGF